MMVLTVSNLHLSTMMAKSPLSHPSAARHREGSSRLFKIRAYIHKRAGRPNYPTLFDLGSRTNSGTYAFIGRRMATEHGCPRPMGQANHWFRRASRGMNR
jgi:hypothetical protein